MAPKTTDTKENVSAMRKDFPVTFLSYITLNITVHSDTSVVVCRFAFRPTFARVVSFRSHQM
ncbi:hypothetical protein T08_2061 [Trichinella sp. T8]|nr:hypothetical protein T08_2061 [Trichinella sp. T8]